MNLSPMQLLAQKRRRSRQLVMQAVYQWQMTGETAHEIEQWFREDDLLEKADEDYFLELLYGVIRLQPELDSELAPRLDRAIEAVDPIERALLRMACYELCHRLDVPYRVVLNEAIDLAKKFGAEKSYQFVNGVLDKLAPGLREQERAAASMMLRGP